MPKRKVITVLSGGLDSTVTAYLVAQLEDVEQHFISFFYGQRHSRELECAAITAKKLKGQHHVISITVGALGVNGTVDDPKPLGSLLGGSALTDTTKVEVPTGHYEAENMKITVVPGRNAMMLSTAWAIASAEGAEFVACGTHKGDHFIYDDCRPEFILKLEEALRLGTGQHKYPVALYTPFHHTDKVGIVKKGIALGVSFGDTWTCYQGLEKACGVCGSCVERLSAFTANNIKDPLEYDDLETWKTFIANANTR